MNETASESNDKKSHRERHSGRKAQKKKDKKNANRLEELTDKQRNPKAFAFNSAIRAERKFRRKQDVDTKKQHIPLVDRTPLEPPPILVAVVGPPKVGKSTLINNLIKLFTRSPLVEIKGPVTIVTGKKRRITFIECNNDINSMIDLAKIADLVLLLCDASFGFEMEIFEFLNICQVHGMPKIMGVLTHLDMIKNAKALKNTKKVLKHRFWTEVYQGAKLFYLSGIIHDEYLRNEIKNLGRFISVMKFRPLTWRTSHSYLLADRYEDLTNQELIRKNPKCDRSVSLYGYVRGVPIKKESYVHIAGLGDVKIRDISFLPDPCPLPEQIKKRALVEKEKLIYAPFSGVGGIVYDKDAVYVDLGGSHSHSKKNENETDNIVSNLIDSRKTLDVKMAQSKIQIFSGGKELTAQDFEEGDEDSEEEEKQLYEKEKIKQNEGEDLEGELEALRGKFGRFKEEKIADSGRLRRKVIFEAADEEFVQTLGEDGKSADEDSEASSDDEGKKDAVNESQREEITVEGNDERVSQTLNEENEDINESERKQLKENTEGSKSSSDDSEDDDQSGNEADYTSEDDDDESSEEEIVINKLQSKEVNKEVIEKAKVPWKRFKKGNNTSSKDSSQLEDTLEQQTQEKLQRNQSNDKLNDQIANISGRKKQTDESIPSTDIYEGVVEDCSDFDSEVEQNVEEEESGDERNQEQSSSGWEKHKKRNSSTNNKDNKSQLEGTLEQQTQEKLLVKEKKKDENIPSTDIHVDEDFSDPDSEVEQNMGEEEEESDDERSSEEIEDDTIKWKENLADKAQNAFLERQSSTQNLMKLVYGIFDVKPAEEESKQPADENENETIGGIFKKVSQTQQKLKLDKDTMNLTETSLILPWNATTKNWLEDQNRILIANCFVTGKWKDSEDATELLKLDDLSDAGSDVFGDFEDMETGEKHGAQKRKRNDDEKDEEADREALAEKKRKLKEKFDEEYDNTEKNTYYDDLKNSAEKQAQLNKTVFENMADEVRVQIEGFRPGMYVRIEIQDVPAEFVENFDPTYPILIGALNMGEENVGFVNVKIKKHRWYGKILKTKDPLIISLGWRRFQTVPLYSKLEDDLKFRFLKYTPEHLACNAHFWGPITPQGSGFLALQSVESIPDILKKQGFRIAATGVVQELDKSTQIMKKLKLVGYPLKIYKKTAFIKGMFNTALEVAKFEGARIKTVSGIRGQIKKAVSKPEGCFRATFEDKILLSDIVFCRTWYKVDVPQFYNPVTTLLLPPEKKNSWKGVRTTGELKREKGIKAVPNQDSLYQPIQRNPKPFKPLIIPGRLQKALPYRDKPKLGVKAADKRKGIDRVAVIREPYEQKVSNLMKMVKANYEHKQEKTRMETKERLRKHQEMIAAQETMKEKKLKQKKKEVFRNRSKAQKNKS